MSKKVKSNVSNGVISGKVNAEEYINEYGYPKVGSFTVEKDLQKFYKQLSNEVVDDWCASEGLEYKPNDNPSINRMRMCMSILYKHFPKPESKKGNRSKYADYSNETLAQMCLDHGVLVETTDDERILRMRLIMALRANGFIE